MSKCYEIQNPPAVYSIDKDGNRTVKISKCLHNPIIVGTK